MGAWKYHKTNRTLDLTCWPHYQIDLDRCNTSAQVLDWIIQVSKKTWATHEIIADLVLKLDSCLDLQGNACSSGVDQAFDAKAWLESEKGKEFYELHSEEFRDFLDRYLNNDRPDGNELVALNLEKIVAAEQEYLSLQGLKGVNGKAKHQ